MKEILTDFEEETPMHVKTIPLTIQLPQPEVTFLENYASRHRLTVANVIDYFIEQLHTIEHYELHPDVAQIRGLLPQAIDARKEYYDYLEEKHR